MALYFADNADAKMETFKEALNASGGSSEWLGYNRFFGNQHPEIRVLNESSKQRSGLRISAVT